jgi:alanyl-tRNA synthetase
MNLKDLYINFFISKGHKQIASAPLIPENDPTTLFNTAGMQPLIPYLLGQPHPFGTRLVDYQKCVRLVDFDGIGDKTHHTFFEMLGNWSLGDYFKKESISWSFELLTSVLGIPVEKLAVTVFAGNDAIPRDEESASIWRSLGISTDRISYLGVDDNFWIAGTTGPCGPDSEIFYWRSTDPVPVKHDPSDKRWVEIWNNVFMQYNMDESGKVTELPHKNVDTGMGFERTVAVLEGVDDNYLSSVWLDVIHLIEELSHKSYSDEKYTKSMRIVADHMRTATFISADDAGIRPSNTDQGYILRRLIRRAIRYARNLEIDINSNWEEQLALLFISKYSKYYSELERNKNIVIESLRNEKNKFNHTLEKGLKEFEKIVEKLETNKLDKDLAFKLYDTYGFPIELTVELAEEKNITVDTEGFKDKFKEHQEKSKRILSSVILLPF